VAALIAYNLAKGISQGKEEDFPIIWEVFLGGGRGDRGGAECLTPYHSVRMPGRAATQFLVRVKELVEGPGFMLVEG